MCPFLSISNTHAGICQLRGCKIWDKERECCSFNTKPFVEIREAKTLDNRSLWKAEVELEPKLDLNLPLYQDQLRTGIEELLGEKTGWGRIELKQRLFDLIDNVGKPIDL